MLHACETTGERPLLSTHEHKSQENHLHNVLHFRGPRGSRYDAMTSHISRKSSTSSETGRAGAAYGCRVTNVVTVKVLVVVKYYLYPVQTFSRPVARATN